MATALKMATQMRDKKADTFFIAKALLNHNYRIKYLGEIMHVADRYINNGMSESEKTRLIRTIEKVKDAESFTANRERESFGLEIIKNFIARPQTPGNYIIRRRIKIQRRDIPVAATF